MTDPHELSKTYAKVGDWNGAYHALKIEAAARIARLREAIAAMIDADMDQDTCELHAIAKAALQDTDNASYD